MPENREAVQLCVTSSEPPSFPDEQLRLFRRVLEDFVTDNLPFTVAGAFAFQCYTGIWRWTKDLDIFLPRQYMERALELCAKAGFETEVRDPVWLAKAWHGEYFVDLISGMSNGVVYVSEEWIARSRTASVFGVTVPLLAPEEMILSKIFVTHRDRFDGADIAHMIYKIGSSLDWNRILEDIGEHWQILLWHLLLFQYVYPRATGNVPRKLWDELVTRFRKELKSAASGKTDQAFRGSLVDEQMFRIDFEEWGMEDLQREARRRRLEADIPKEAVS